MGNNKLNFRILWPDILKSLAVFLVILGHVSSTYDSQGYSSPLALWIYSFHMPLFMMLSGMFFKYSLKKDFKTLLIDKSRLLLLPLLSWGLMNFIIETLLFADINKWGGVIVDYIKSGGSLRGYWYLKCLFIYLIVNYLLAIWTKKLPIAALVSVIIFLILPNINFSRMMIVFFWMGVFFEDIQRTTGKKNLFFIASVAMVVCYLSLDIKATYLCSSSSMALYIQFLLTGTSASLFWITLFERLIPRRYASKPILLLQEVGTLSLGIYCIHEFFYFEKLYRPIWERLNTDSMFVQITYSIVVFILSFAFIKLIGRNKYASLVFLGRKLPSKQKDI